MCLSVSVSVSHTHTHTHRHTQIYNIRISLQTSFLWNEEKRKLLLTYQWHLPAGNEITLGHTRAPGEAQRPDLKWALSPSAIPPPNPRTSTPSLFLFFVPPSLFLLKFPPCGCVLLTSHLLWCELHICEWMTGKINSPAPFSLTVGPANE